MGKDSKTSTDIREYYLEHSYSEEPLLTYSEAAELAKTKKKTLQNAVSAGELDSIGKGRLRRFRPSDIIVWLWRKGGADEAKLLQEPTGCNSEEANHTEKSQTAAGLPSGSSTDSGTGKGQHSRRKLTWKGSSQKSKSRSGNHLRAGFCPSPAERRVS